MPLDSALASAAQETIADTRTVAAEQIPVIDVGALVTGDLAARQAVGDEMAEAFVTWGFCYVANHGVPQASVDAALAVLPHFFSLPVEEKSKVAINRNMRGFMGMHRHTQVHGKKPNRSESYIFGRDLPADDPHRMAGIPFYDTNYWPEGLDEFRTTLEAYWRDLEPFAYRLNRALALAMQQDEGYFDDMYRKPDTLIRCVSYPPAEGDFSGQFGAAPHSDNGTLTILAQDRVGGLQLQTLAGDWINAPSIPGTFVINVGDMIMRMTNGVFRSTPHRVVSSPRHRYSMPLFFYPDHDARIEPLAPFVTADNPARYEPIVWGEYLQGQFGLAYDHYSGRSAA